jgi:hypothetical protein
MASEATPTGPAGDDSRGQTRGQSHGRQRARPSGPSGGRRRTGSARLLLPLAAAFAFALVALAPQLMLWHDRGRHWQGHAASVHPDESVYLAYANALAWGRVRRADPYTGRDAEMTAARAETMYTIQLLPAYALALPGRLFGVATDTTFIALTFVAAFLAVLAVERLIAAAVPGAPHAAWLSTAGALFVLSFAALARAQKLVLWLTGEPSFFIPLLFLRRYQPAASFPLLFVFCLLVWLALTRGERGKALACAAAGGAVFAALVYSYFYLWTAALAWLACLAAPWLLVRRGDRRRAAEVLAVVGAFALSALVPWALLLARRPPWIDSDQLLEHTRAPDPFRPPELIGLACAALLAYAARRGVISLRDDRALLAASFALTPAAVFNQQVLTGLSLQPIHYELFAANYFALVALVLTCALLRQARRRSEISNLNDVPDSSTRDPQPATRNRPYPRRALAAVAALSLGWAVFEVTLVARRYRSVNVQLDESYAAAVLLAELARADGESARALVFTSDGPLADWQQAAAPQPVLWAAHMFSLGAVSPAEDRERLFTQFYLTGVDAREFAGPVVRRHRGSLFGWGRAFPGLVAKFRPVSPEEERAAAEAYARFAENFGRAEAARFPLRYAVIDDKHAARLANLDRWYEREWIGRAGAHTLYRLRLRP